MNVCILGGNSSRHYQWNRQLGAFLEAAGHAVLIHDYLHWSTGEATADIDTEVTRLTERVAGLHATVIIAKSIGTVISTLAVARGTIRPRACILLGIPLNGIAEKIEEFAPGLGTLPRCIVLQNEYDPYGNAFDVEQYCQDAEMNDLTFVSCLGNNSHDYLDFVEIETQLQSIAPLTI